MSFLKELVQEINSVRTNPKDYVEKIERYKSYFVGKILKVPNSKINIQTKEGPDAYEECANFLKTAEPICELIPSKALTKMSNELLEVVKKDPGELGSVDMNALIEKYGSFAGNFNRVMECGGATPEQVVINLLVSDGEKTRGQRDALLSKSLKRVGVASGEHDIYRTATMILFCTKFDNKVDPDDTENYEGETTSAPSKPETTPTKTEPDPKPMASAPPKEEPKAQPTQPDPKPMASAPPKEEPKAQPAQPEPKPAIPTPAVEHPKPVIKQPPTENTAEGNDDVKIETHKRVIVEGGKRKNKITITKTYKDGRVEKEVRFENL